MKSVFQFLALSFLLGISLCVAASANADEKKEYAIVIHGGAGSSPDQFSQEQNKARRDSLKKALEIGKAILEKGGTSLDAVEAVIRQMENDPLFNAGKGAVINAVGKHELDASIMNGQDKSCGAVAGVSNVKNPISLARKVMTETRHVLLSGPGAEEFAKQMNVPLVDNTYFRTKAKWDRWLKQQQRRKDLKSKSGNLSQPDAEKVAGNKKEKTPPTYYGTVGCVALDKKGNIAAGTSTGGLTNKKFGRVGDSPIVGAGTYADNATCGVSGTGIGEQYIRNAAAFQVSALMEYKSLSVSDAVKFVLEKKLKKGDGGLIALDHQGNITAQFNTRGMSSAMADSTGMFQINWGKE